MTIKTRTAVLVTKTGGQERVVKRTARRFFRFVRDVASDIQGLPRTLRQAASDVGTAWEESSRPNA